ncbi:MAG: sigma-70 family RNA polymerase sigma factor [Terracidiphilus sp.]|jgi:RNA polymerase sigma-70 factor (ECF subfamily)
MSNSIQESYLAYKQGTLPLQALLLASRAFVVGIARLEGSDRADAEDLAQQACVAVWRRVDRFDGARASYPTWLRGILRGVIYDKFRHAQVKEANAEIVGMPQHELVRDDLADATFHTPEQLKVKLTADQTALVRALGDGLEMRDIALSMGLTLKVVQQRFYRIISKCRG